ncbi:hypothetical protein VC136_06585 [Citrobacter freundii]|nr:hypothetical protein [Citrobacter freundii]MEB2764175.1 hypothetical protein [Citrobacter freundii]
MAVQLANAESKCRELAVENAGLKATCEDRRTFIMNGVQLGYIKVPTVDTDPALETIRIAVSPQEPTPITDAFLAEMRAVAVDEFLRDSQLPYQIATVLADYDNVDDATLQAVIWSGQPPEPDGDVWHLEYVSRGNAIVRAVLKELRKGAAL